MYRFCYSINKNVATKIQFYIIEFIAILMFFPVILWGKIDFYEIFPNTIDDTNMEYIELRNTGCSDIDISGYILEDASGKQYIFPISSIISSKNTLRIDRPTSKIILNNVDEVLYLKHPNGTLEDQYSYTSSTKGVTIVDISVMQEDCSIQNSSGIITEIDNSGIINTGSANSGNISSGGIFDNTENISPEITSTNSGELSGTGNIESTGSIEPTEPIVKTGISDGNTYSEHNNTGNIIEFSTSNTGNELSNTEIYESGSIDDNSGETNFTGNIETSSLISFPEIIPTLQNPTNATFASGFFDCTNQNPCRINVTFDPIFTDGYLAKNYTCSVITETGSLASCNPSTLYFVTGSTLGFRLTSKLYPDESKEKFWNIVYKTAEIPTEGGSKIINNSIKFEDQETNSGSFQTGETQSEIQFPEIIPTFQNYTNTIFSGNTLICTTSPCRLNLTLDPIFTGSFQTKDYTCQIQYGTGIYNTCNPSQLYLNGTGSIHISIANKKTQKNIYKILEIIQNIQSNNGGTVSSNSTSSIGLIDKNPPIIILEFDGKMKSYHEIIGENEINCYTFTCSINLSAERSYDRENTSIRYLWYYGPNDIKTTKDPGERKYGIGTHEIWLRVIDLNNNVSSVKYTIHVLGNREIKKEEIKKIEKKTKIKSTQPKTKVKKSKIKKSNKTIFFDPPEIILQKSRFTKSENGFICYTNTKSCSINLSLSGAQKGIKYTWKYDNREKITSKNPKSQSFSPGKHTIKVSAGYSENTPIWTKDIEILVIKTTKPKKIKVKKVTKKEPKKIIPDTKIDTNTMEIKKQNNTKESSPYLSLIILIGMVPMIFFRKKSEYKK